MVEKRVDVLERYVLICTTSGWHMLRICHGHGENALEAIMTHAVATGEFGGFVYGHIISHTCQAGNPRMDVSPE